MESLRRMLAGGNAANSRAEQWGLTDAVWIDNLFSLLQEKKYDDVKQVIKQEELDVNKPMFLGWKSYGGDLAWRAGYGATLMHLVSAEGDVEAIKLILSLGGDPLKKTSSTGETSFDVAGSAEARKEIAAAVDSTVLKLFNSSKMTDHRLGEILKSLIPTLTETRPGCYEALLPQGFHFQCMTCPPYDRMRFVIPILRVGQASRDFLLKCLSANFHSALDAKYAVDEGILWSTFIHPLSPLSEEQVEDAINQVITLAQTTGSEFRSSNLSFVGKTSSGDENSMRRLTPGQMLSNSAEVAIKPTDEPPDHFVDPLTFEVMLDPVVTPSGHTFERHVICAHIAAYANNPFTKEKLTAADLTPNRALRDAIEEWVKTHES